MRFSPFFFPTTQRRAGDGQAEGSAVAAPSGGEQRWWRGQATDELWLRCGLSSSQVGGEGGGDRPAIGTGRQQALAGRKVSATGAGG
jgi:hypothetical protein